MSAPSILLTGSSGTIGTQLAEVLLEAGYDIQGVDAMPNRWSERVDKVTTVMDLTDPAAVRSLPTDVDMVIHFAANARVHQLVKRPEGAKENLDMTFNILEYVRKANIASFLFASSREVYGNSDKTIYSERDTFADECESPYTASKVAGEAMVDGYQQCYGIESCIFRFSNVYGKYDASDRVVPLFIAQAHRGEDLTVYGSNKVLDFTHVEDCASAVARAVEDFHKVSGMTLNVASGEGTSLLDLAKVVSQRAPTDVDVSVEPNRTGEVSRFVADITRAEKILGYEPSYPFDDGIDAAIEWYRDNDQLFDEILQE